MNRFKLNRPSIGNLEEQSRKRRRKEQKKEGGGEGETRMSRTRMMAIPGIHILHLTSRFVLTRTPSRLTTSREWNSLNFKSRKAGVQVG